jgi:hypothetical protein
MKKSLGQIAYEAYCKKTRHRSLVTGLWLPKWKQSTDEIREAWNIAAEAVSRALIIEAYRKAK